MACGSYRRGRATCGDVDVLVTHPDGKSHKGVFGKLLNDLRDSGVFNVYHAFYFCGQCLTFIYSMIYF